MDQLEIIQDTIGHLGHVLADAVANYPLVFTVCHIVLTLHSVKGEWVSSNAINNPLANYLLGLCCCNAGGIITSFLTNNKTALECIFFGNADPKTMLIYTIIWWMTFYCPYKAFSKALQDEKTKKSTIIMQILLIGKELLRTKKIYTGVDLGTIASNGTGFLVNLGKFITARPYSGLVLLGTSTLAKFSVCFSILYTLYPSAKYLIVLAQFVVLVNYKLHLAPFADGVEKSFKMVGGCVTQPFGEEKSDKPDQKSKNERKKKQ